MDDQELNCISTKTDMLSHVTVSQHSTSIRVIPKVNYRIATPFEINHLRITKQLDNLCVCDKQIDIQSSIDAI